jgi:cell division septation protein DedD
MDRSLLERMVGAVVLVLLLVLLAPALLDGEQTESGTVDDVRTAGRTRTEVIVLNEPSRATTSAPQKAVRTPVERPVAAPQKSSPERIAAVEPTSGFAVQLGSFSQRANAQQYAAKLEQGGYGVIVAQGATASGSVYRVYAGPAKTRPEAEKLAAKLGGAGLVVDLDSKDRGAR